jgi:PAS domain S-box-containing protein
MLDPDGDTLWVGTRAMPVYDGDGEPVRVLATGTDVSDRKEREQALEESRERYQTLLQASPDPVFVADTATGDIVEANAAAEEILDRPRDEIVGHGQTELHPEGDAELYREAFERSVGRSGMISELPNGAQPQLRTADGGTVPVEINADTVQLPRGSVMYGVFRDISERKERERELELKERAMDEANVGITISDPDQEDNPLVYANDGFVEQTGYTRADAVGRNRRFLRADDSDQPALNDLRDAIAADEATTVELRNYRKDGEQFWNRLSVTPVYDEQDRLTNYIGIQQDITQEKTREQRLEALYAATRSLLEAQTASEAFDVGSETLEDALGLAVANFYESVDGALVRGPGGETELLDPPERVEPGSRPLWEAFESGNTVVYDDVETIDDDLDRGRPASAGYFPVGEHGVVAVGTTDPDRLDDAERRLVEMLTTNMASVLNTIERQRDLVEERERFRLLTESVDEYAFIIVDEDGTIQTWNDSAESLFGYDDDAALGMSMAELHLETDRESGLPDRLLQQAQVAGESAHEGWRVRADGSEFYADVRHAPLETDDGEFRGYAKIVRDMTDRRRERRRTERFVGQSEDVVSILDPDGTITYTSGSAERVLGYDPDDLLGENLFDYIHPDGREHALKMFYSCVDGNEEVTAECRLASPDRGWFNVEGHCRNMLDDEAIDGILVYIRDVTESKERARRFESIFNQTFQFTGLLDPDGAVIEANDAAVDFGGFERDDIVGEPFYDAPWWTHSDDVYDDIRNAIDRAADGEFVRYETEVRGADGLATIDFSVKPVTDDDEEVSMLVVEGRDITDQEQHRRHLNVMQRVMRHNMRNDLTKMRGWTQAMAEETDADARVEYLDTVDQVLDKWGEMMEKMKEIRTVIEFQKDQETRQEAAALVEDAVAPVREEHAGGTVVTDVPDTGLQVPATLRDAVRELVENAAEASAETTVEVELDRSADGWTKIVVRDDGPGMPEMEADVLETGEETPLNHGQGLGLWMVRMVVTQAGGDASVESTEDGTEVCLRVPASQTVGGQSIETTG